MPSDRSVVLKAVLAYLSRYTHRVAIANQPPDRARRQNGVSFAARIIGSTALTRHKVMTLATTEFIRRFLIHVLPKGFHRIRHYGLLQSPLVPTTSPAPASCSRYHKLTTKASAVMLPTLKKRRSTAVHAAAAA